MLWVENYFKENRKKNLMKKKNRNIFVLND